jgi:selenocysteine-specific elongation factor
VAGFGAVVTGTLLDGTFRVGDEIVLLPGNKTARIRGLQNHSESVDEIGPGNRVAVNISGIDSKEIKRGDVIAHLDTYQTTGRLDVNFTYLDDINKPLIHDQEVKLFIGADETVSRVRVLGVDKIQSGQSGFLQLEVEDPVVALRGDHFILRRPSPSETLGGGIVIDPFPPYRHKRFDTKTLTRLESISEGDPKDVILQELSSKRFSSWKALLDITGLKESTVKDLLDEMISDGIALEIGKKNKKIISLKVVWDEILSDLKNRIVSYHQNNTMKAGMPLEELKSQAKLPEMIFKETIKTLTESGDIIQTGPFLRQKVFEIKFSKDQQLKIEELLSFFNENPTQPPSVAECKQAVGNDVYNALLSLQKLKQISADVVFTPEAYQMMVKKLKSKIKKDGPVTVAQTRDMFGSSRKYILAFLEKLDADGVTVREGDVRKLNL